MTIEVIEGLERKATFSIKKDVVQASVKDELKKYAKKAKVPGFRPGKVPANVLEKMYGGEAYEDSLNKHLQTAITNLIVENKLSLAGYPKCDLTSSEGEEFVFSALFEVLPEIKLNPLSDLEIEKPTGNISAKDVEETIENFRKQRATYKEVDAAATNNHKVKIDFVGTIDGAEFAGGSSKDYEFALGQGMMLPDFEAGINGLKAGETVEVNVKFPEDYHAEEFRNKTAVFKITLNKVEEEVLPELNEEFIKSLGIADGTDATLRTEVETNLNREIKRRLNVKLRENVLNTLLKANPIEVAKSTVHDEIHHMMDNASAAMKQRGYKDDQIKLTHDMFRDDATRLVKLRTLIQELIKENNLSINDEDTDKVIRDLAFNYDNVEEYIKWYTADQTRVQNAKAIAMEQRVIDHIVGIAKIKEVELNNVQNLLRERI